MAGSFLGPLMLDLEGLTLTARDRELLVNPCFNFSCRDEEKR